MTVALTGATGFVGKALLKRLLDEGYHVKTLIRRDNLPDHKNLTKMRGDLTDPDALQALCDGVSSVIHCAGLTKALRREDMIKVNENGTKAIVRAAQAAGVNRFLYISSLAARAPEVSIYAQSKRDGERAFDTITDDMGWDILRPPAVYGPGDTQVLTFFKMIKNRLALIAGPKHARISMIYIDDLVDAIYAWLASKDATQDVYEIAGADDTGFLWEEIIDKGANTLGMNPVKIHLPRFMTYLVGYAGGASGYLTRRPPLLSPDKIGELLHNDWTVRETKFETRFDWAPKINLDKGFGQTVDWYYQQGWL